MRKAVTGLRAWLVQRVTAIYMRLFVVASLLHFAVEPPHSYVAWQGWVTGPILSICTMVFFTALFAHAWVGLRDVIMDYVHPLAVRVCLLVLLGFSLAAMMACLMRILLTGHG
ncbi:succinate dehydrogenase, hydrophobic membrane anchor protein [Caballeronia glebae]|uniref:succinate dehydrogenase, hydrophobic membrane anchor protein n=1 Tax=Caballeronia glebae TaxID=1777143 RepID=UPI0038BC9AF3